MCVCWHPLPHQQVWRVSQRLEELHGRVAWSCLPGLRGTSGESVGPHKRMGGEEAAGGHKHLGRGRLRSELAELQERTKLWSLPKPEPLSLLLILVRSNLEKKLQNHPHPRSKMTTPNPGADPPTNPFLPAHLSLSKSLWPLSSTSSPSPNTGSRRGEVSWCFQLLGGTGHVDFWTVSLPVTRSDQRLISAERISSRASEISHRCRGQ